MAHHGGEIKKRLGKEAKNLSPKCLFGIGVARIGRGAHEPIGRDKVLIAGRVETVATSGAATTSAIIRHDFRRDKSLNERIDRLSGGRLVSSRGKGESRTKEEKTDVQAKVFFRAEEK